MRGEWQRCHASNACTVNDRASNFAATDRHRKYCPGKHAFGSTVQLEQFHNAAISTPRAGLLRVRIAPERGFTVRPSSVWDIRR